MNIGFGKNAIIPLTCSRKRKVQKISLRHNASGSSQDVIKYNDGCLIKRKNNKCSFYGIVTPEKIIKLCNEAGFKHYEVTKHDGSCYIKAYDKHPTL